MEWKHCDAWLTDEGRICDKPAVVDQGGRLRCREHDPYMLYDLPSYEAGYKAALREAKAPTLDLIPIRTLPA